MARHVRELMVWQLADALRQLIFEITSEGPVVRDFDFRDQLRSAALSVPSNIAEGFGRYGHGDFARFVNIAKASLDEVEGLLLAGARQKYFEAAQADTARRLVIRTNVALLRLKRYLVSSRAPAPFGPRRT